MNKVIKKFLEQVSLQPYYDSQEQQIENFAKLIIEKCASLVSANEKLQILKYFDMTTENHNPMINQLKDLLDTLHAKSNNSYNAYINKCRADCCLAPELKMWLDAFKTKELEAHKSAATELGRYQVLQEIIGIVSTILAEQELTERNLKIINDCEK